MILILIHQQHNLALLTSELVFMLLRPYFADALLTHTRDPTRSPYGMAYLAVFERSKVSFTMLWLSRLLSATDSIQMMVAVLISLHSLFPLISVRHWFFWVRERPK